MEKQKGDSLPPGADPEAASSQPPRDDDDGSGLVWLSLGSIYNSAVDVVEPTAAAAVSPAAAVGQAGSCSHAVPAGMMPHPVGAPPAAAVGVPSTVFFGLTPDQIASSPPVMVDGNHAAASPVQLSPLPISLPVLIVAPPAAISLPARQIAAMPIASPVPVNHQSVQAPPAAASPACTEPPVAPQDPVVIGGGSGSGSASPSPAASNGATGHHDSGLPLPPLPANTTQESTRRRRRANAPPESPVDVGHAPPESPTIQPPFPWATNRAAIHYSIPELASRGITSIDGEVQCSKCQIQKTISYNLITKFAELRAFIARNIHTMLDRAPESWSSTKLASSDCGDCGQKHSVRPVIPAEHERINWVFMLLGQTLGLLNLDNLKHFCAHAKQHRTGAKDRVLYSTYMALCSQLSPVDNLFCVTADRKKRSRSYCA